ncbi:MAG TPA: hypothetical protein VGB17_03060, partial [Pyrinomonadaceae bacterium]
MKRFEQYGILRGDTAIVVMNGDVRIGELGYFGITCTYNHKPASYLMLAFVCEQDETCFDGDYNGSPRSTESLCLRSDNVKKCQGLHNAQAYGRVCAVERNHQPVEPSLTFRPFDERSDATGEVTTWRTKKNSQKRVKPEQVLVQEGDTPRFEVGDYVRWID